VISWSQILYGAALSGVLAAAVLAVVFRPRRMRSSLLSRRGRTGADCLECDLAHCQRTRILCWRAGCRVPPSVGKTQDRESSPLLLQPSCLGWDLRGSNLVGGWVSERSLSVSARLWWTCTSTDLSRESKKDGVRDTTGPPWPCELDPNATSLADQTVRRQSWVAWCVPGVASQCGSAWPWVDAHRGHHHLWSALALLLNSWRQWRFL